MTDTEKILNLLEVNEGIPTLVTEDDGSIISGNNIFNEKFDLVKSGQNFQSFFDKNTALLIKNYFIDAKIFLKIQRKEVQLLVDDLEINLKLVISPFKLDTRIYFFILLYNNDFKEELLLYPTLDDNDISVRYKSIVNLLKDSLPKTLIEKKNLQYLLDIEKKSIGIKDKVQFLFTNSSFRSSYSIKDNYKNVVTIDDILPEKINLKIRIAENEVYNTFSLFIIEKKELSNSSVQKYERVILFPILSRNGIVECTLLLGNIDLDNSNMVEKHKENDEVTNNDIELNKEKVINHSEVAQIIYDKNNFDILDANISASELYGYDVEELKNMNLTKLFLPEDMQKLIMPPKENGKFIFRHLTKDNSIIEVNVERENIIWNEQEAYSETIVLNQLEEEVIELEEFDEKDKLDVKSDINNLNEDKPEVLTDFLSSMFHEMLTPVNVILGFVQEIIDSIDNPTDEQEESSQIIKDNQTILLHTMNTAVQYAQLYENRIPLSTEEFDLNNYLVDLQDSFSRVSDKENAKVVFGEIPEPLKIKHDRTKLLAAISYFIKFVIKLSKSSKVFVSIKLIDDKVYLIANDSENGLSESVFNEVFEIFNTSKINERKSYGVSSITIRLAKKLNDLLLCKVEEYIDESGVRFAALVIPAIFEYQQNSLAETSLDKTVPLQDKVIEHEDETVKEEIINNDAEDIKPKKFISVKPAEIINGDVDKEIIKDIEEEKEIVTEEIATIEAVDNQSSYISGLSCLFIDDNLDTQLLFKNQMKDFKSLKVCSNLTEALPILSKYNFDLIIVDVNLNDTYNGLDALKIIRQFPYYATIPIIAVTAYSFDGDRDKFINFGFTDYLIKPLLREQLLKSLEVII